MRRIQVRYGRRPAEFAAHILKFLLLFTKERSQVIRILRQADSELAPLLPEMADALDWAALRSSRIMFQ